VNFLPYHQAVCAIPAGASGVYVIKGPGMWIDEVLYVGESHTGNLRKTLTRHFQRWKGKTAGPTYGRRKVRVAVLQMKNRGKVVAVQNALIKRFSPRDNTAEKLSLIERLLS